MPNIHPDLVNEISENHLVTTELSPADLLFVFGTRAGVPEFVEEIVGLWHRGLFKHCIVSGGISLGGTESECTVIKRSLVQQGVPAEIILEEHNATNTGENVQFSLPLIEKHLGLDSVRSVIALGKICTSRRYLMTLQRYWPAVEKMLVAVNYFDVPRDRWYLDPAFRDRVVSEFRKIEPYRDAGLIVDWP